MTFAEKVFIIGIVMLIIILSGMFVSSYEARTKGDVFVTAFHVVEEAVRNSSFYHKGDITYWTDYLYETSWKHPACSSNIPSDCYVVEYVKKDSTGYVHSDTPTELARIIQKDSQTGENLREKILLIYQVPEPPSLSSPQMLATRLLCAPKDFHTAHGDLTSYYQERKGK